MITVLDSLNSALHQAMTEDPSVIVLGEDILDPYGGAFRVTRGLSTQFPDRVLTTPISEAGIIGAAAGMAMRGLRPVVEIMFGDFLALAADQLINHASKFRWMYNDQVHVPLVVRTPMGGRRGYGPTHSQTLEKHFLGVPGLTVLAPTSLADPCSLLKEAVLSTQDPVLFIENKLLYLLHVSPDRTSAEFETRTIPSGVLLSIRGAPPASLTLASYGYAAELSRQAALRMAYDHELFCDLVVLTRLSPFDVDPILDSASRTKHLVCVEEGPYTMGWGAEIAAQVTEKANGQIAISRVAAQDLPVPASGPLETRVLPGIEDIISAAIRTSGRKPA